MPGRPEPHHITAVAFRLHAEHGTAFTRAMRDALGRILLIEGDDSPELLPLLESLRRRQGGKSLLESSESSANRGSDPTHEFATVQLDLPDWLADRVRRLARRLSPSDVSEYEDAPHITVRYGLHADSSSDVSACVVDSPPVKVRLGETDYFAGDNHDVVYVSVEDAGDGELKALRDSIGEGCPHTETRKGYTPHVTLAYVRKGCGKDYAGMLDLDGVEVEFRAVTFCDRDGRRSIIPLWQADAILEGIGWGEDEIQEEEDCGCEDDWVLMEDEGDWRQEKSRGKGGIKWVRVDNPKIVKYQQTNPGAAKAPRQKKDAGTSGEKKPAAAKKAKAEKPSVDVLKAKLADILQGGDVTGFKDEVMKLTIPQIKDVADKLAGKLKGRKAEMVDQLIAAAAGGKGKGEEKPAGKSAGDAPSWYDKTGDEKDVKAPHEMTGDEFALSRGKRKGTADYARAVASHRAEMGKRLEAGLPVPDDVLDSHKGLRAAYAPDEEDDAPAATSSDEPIDNTPPQEDPADAESRRDRLAQMRRRMEQPPELKSALQKAASAKSLRDVDNIFKDLTKGMSDEEIIDLAKRSGVDFAAYGEGIGGAKFGLQVKLEGAHMDAKRSGGGEEEAESQSQPATPKAKTEPQKKPARAKASAHAAKQETFKKLSDGLNHALQQEGVEIKDAIQSRLPVSVSHIREKAGLSKEEFDRELLAAADRGEIMLWPHGHPGILSPADRDKLIYNPEDGTYYVDVTPLSGYKSVGSLHSGEDDSPPSKPARQTPKKAEPKAKPAPAAKAKKQPAPPSASAPDEPEDAPAPAPTDDKLRLPDIGDAATKYSSPDEWLLDQVMNGTFTVPKGMNLQSLKQTPEFQAVAKAWAAKGGGGKAAKVKPAAKVKAEPKAKAEPSPKAKTTPRAEDVTSRVKDLKERAGRIEREEVESELEKLDLGSMSTDELKHIAKQFSAYVPKPSKQAYINAIRRVPLGVHALMTAGPG